MILHLGGDETVSQKAVVAIIRHDCLTATRAGRRYLASLAESPALLDISGGRPGCLVLLENNRAVLSAISAQTLTRRCAERFSFSEEAVEENLD